MRHGLRAPSSSFRSALLRRLHFAKHTPYDHFYGRYTMVTGLNISLPTNPRQHIKV